MSTSVPPPGMPEPEPALAEPGSDSDSATPASGNARLMRLGVLVAGVVALVVVAFVAFGSSGSSTLDPVAQAATTSANAPGFNLRMSLRIASPAIQNPITGTGTGSFDTAAHSGGLSLTMNTPQGALTMQEVISGHVVYVKLPSSLAGALPLGGKPWVSIDLSKLSSVPGLSSLLDNPASSNPGEMLQYLRAVSDSVVSEGNDQVNGFATKHYRAQIDFDKVPAALPAAAQADARKAISAIETQAHIHTVPVDVWVDGHHLVRRMTMSMSPSIASGPSLNESFTIDFLSYGPQHPPAAPPSSQVADLSKLIGSGG